MKVIIAGSRTFTNMEVLKLAIKDAFNVNGPNFITEVVCGGARGMDTLGEKWAKVNGIPVKYFLPDWNKHGKGAGFIRNKQMADYADALLLVWDGKSKGSANMLSMMKAQKKPIVNWEIID